MKIEMKNYLILIFMWALFIAILNFVFGCESVQKPSAPIKKSALAWNNPEWDSILIDEINSKLDVFDKAKDIKDYCPKWSLLNAESKSIAVAQLFVAIAKFESGYKITSSMTESTGQDSIGLFQLSYGDRFCPKSKAEGSLTNPEINIKCAVKIAASFVGRDNLIASGGYVSRGASKPLGMARYWAVIREPDSKRPHKKKEIQDIVKSSEICK